MRAQAPLRLSPLEVSLTITHCPRPHRDVIFECFSVLVDEFGAHRTVDLVPGGRDIPVVESNKAAYVDAVIEWRLGSQGAMKDQIRELRAGFRE